MFQVGVTLVGAVVTAFGEPLNMPILCACHPTNGDTDISSWMLDDTLDAIDKQAEVDHSYDLPYVAGYSKNGKIIYIDQHVPEKMILNGKNIDIWNYLILHEAVEKSLLMHELLHYQMAHQIALRTEKDAVENDGHNWKGYNKLMMGFIKADRKELLLSVPKDLDTQPYKDEHDFALLRQMVKAMKNG